MNHYPLVGSQMRHRIASGLCLALAMGACVNAAFSAGADAPFGQGSQLAVWRSHAGAMMSNTPGMGNAVAYVSAGGITIGSNPVAGCALWSWKWGGKEFLNQRDFGRLIQSSIAVAGHYGFVPNPTEAGDKYTTPEMRPNEKHGSPCIKLFTVTARTDEFPWASAATPVVSTRAVPLEWTPENLSGGPTSPMVWKDLVIGKDITLNYNNMGPVAKYTTVVRVPRCAGACTSFSAEIPTGYMTGEFEFQCVYDAKTRECRPVNLQPNGAPLGVFPPTGYGGVIFATRDHQFAMGIYGVSTQAGGSVTMPGGGISLAHFGAAHDGNDPTAANTYKWAVHGNSAFVDGDIRFNVYLVSGTLDSVESLMSNLAAAGAK